MGVGRVFSTCVAAVAVAGCAVLVIGMSRADADRQATANTYPPAAPTSEVMSSIPAQRPAPTTSHRVAAAPPNVTTSVAAAAAVSHPATSSAAPTPSSTPKPTPTATPTSHAASHPATQAAAPEVTVKSTPTASPKPKASAVRAAAPRRGQSLPLHFSTGKATRVITVVAHSKSSTTARLQAWTKAPGGGWLKSGHTVTAHVGADGLSTSPSEFKSATPIGSFTLTQAFGRNSNPGTSLPYFKTTPADWWISQAGALYNTHQRCSSGCAFTQGSPNEHLYYETPYYNYAVVIDANTRNTGHVKQYGGSAFFLHVTDGRPTAGCVAISQTKLTHLMRSLTPHKHPRILIGVA
jgi:L,D-peptidoglycan transpeptidase YkuD (ErfK/YbiS/YcfS/YnhG family)